MLAPLFFRNFSMIFFHLLQVIDPCLKSSMVFQFNSLKIISKISVGKASILFSVAKGTRTLSLCQLT